jgi:CBS domain-containing protein
MTDAARTVTVSPETTLKEVAERMLEHRVSGVPVVDADGRVVGVVSEADFVTGETGGAGGEGMIARARAIVSPAAVAISRTAGEAMSSPAVTIRPDETVMHAASLIAGRGVKRLPVVDDDDRLVGIIARADIVRSFARSDEEIAREIRGDVERILGLGPDRVRVTVADGEVHLSGEADTDTNAKLAAFFASRVLGVVAVRSDLQASDDDGDRGDGVDGPSAG